MPDNDNHTTAVIDTGHVGAEDRFDGHACPPAGNGGHDAAALGDTLQHSVVSSDHASASSRAGAASPTPSRRAPRRTLRAVVRYPWR